jgi:uncharacterized protein (TIGR04255 family)
MRSPLPDFDNPPVVEVAISLQFSPLDLHASHFGLLWSHFRREGYPRTEDHGTLEPAIEQFGTTQQPEIGVRVQTFDDAPPLPRVWFLNDTQDELIQVQRDRLIVNWRQGAQSEPYPRYANIIKRHRASLTTLTSFAESENLGAIVPTQCEITYVNHLPMGEGWSRHGDLEPIITTWRNHYSDSYLGVPEDVRLLMRYRMNDEQDDPLGRLHVVVQPASRTIDKQPILVMNLTARGTPGGTSVTAVYELFDRQHEWIVRGFASITTKEMHLIWRRKNGD